MASFRIGYVGLFLLTFCSLGLAQSSPGNTRTGESSQPAAQSDVGSSASAQPETAAKARRRGHPTPCWRQAGLTPDIINQRWKLEDEQKTQIAAVCAEPSTSAQQKRQKIEQIQVETDQAIARLIPIKERKAFDQCQAELERSKPHATGDKELGPCGGMMPSDEMSNDTEDHSH